MGCKGGESGVVRGGGGGGVARGGRGVGCGVARDGGGGGGGGREGRAREAP